LINLSIILALIWLRTAACCLTDLLKTWFAESMKVRYAPMHLLSWKLSVQNWYCVVMSVDVFWEGMSLYEKKNPVWTCINQQATKFFSTPTKEEILPATRSWSTINCYFRIIWPTMCKLWPFTRQLLDILTMVHQFFEAIASRPKKADFFANKNPQDFKFSVVFSVFFPTDGYHTNTKLLTWLDLISDRFVFLEVSLEITTWTMCV